jgi:hypothetical protein
MNFKLQFLVISFLMLMSFACDDVGRRRATAQTDMSDQQEEAPLLEIAVSPIRRLDDPLELGWKITNRAGKVLYVYSTLLQKSNSDFVEINIDAQRKIIEIRFTSLEQLEVAPNYFPNTEFARVDPQRSLEGSFRSNHPIRQLVSYRAAGKGIKGDKITAGAWKIRSLVAYGFEMQSVENASAKSIARGTEHPINPIVRWQRIAYSEFVSVTFI